MSRLAAAAVLALATSAAASGVARLDAVKLTGAVEMQAFPGGNWIKVKRVKLAEGVCVRTGQESSVDFVDHEGRRVFLAPESTLCQRSADWFEEMLGRAESVQVGAGAVLVVRG